MASSIPKKILVALSESPEEFAQGRYKIVPPEQARVSVFDRSFHFGDSVYEVARTYGGTIFGLDAHFDRIEHSAQLAAFATFPKREVLSVMIRDTCRRWFETFGNAEVYVRWMVSRGVSDLNINPGLSSPPYGFVFVKALEAPSREDFERGLHFIIAERRRNNPRALEPRMKSGNYLNNILAFTEAKARGAHDAIMLDLDGYITEGTTNNVYMVKAGEILTAPSSVGLLEGITRSFIFKAAAGLGIKMREVLITAPEFKAADEMFMSSSIKEIQPITRLDGRTVGDGQCGLLTRQLASELSRLIQQHTESHRHESLFLKN